jgi:mannose/fructose/N-acetylgalactosamine-specific phosphotransferase system component IID
MRLIFWILVALTAGVYGAMALWSIPKIVADAGGLMPFDMRPAGYSAGEARAFIGALSEQGRQFYQQVQHGLDSAYPGLMAVTLVMAFRSMFQGVMRFFWSGFAILGAVFDYLENAAVAIMLKTPVADITDAMVHTASRWTILKSLTVTIALTGLIIGLVLVWRRKRKAKHG